MLSWTLTLCIEFCHVGIGTVGIVLVGIAPVGIGTASQLYAVGQQKSTILKMTLLQLCAMQEEQYIH